MACLFFSYLFFTSPSFGASGERNREYRVWGRGEGREGKGSASCLLYFLDIIAFFVFHFLYAFALTITVHISAVIFTCGHLLRLIPSVLFVIVYF